MSLTDEILQPDQVESLLEALRRLAAGAGKPPYDRITVDNERGWTFNGEVYTQVFYPFGFEATLMSDSLKAVVGHLLAPSIKVTDKRITVKEGGKTFRLGKLEQQAMRPSGEPPENFTDFQGKWWRGLLPLLPKRTGFRSFAGIYAEPKGYIGCDDNQLCHIEAPGPATPIIVSRELVEMLPSGSLQLGASEDGGTIWVKSENSTWTCPALVGEYPPWESVFIPMDREAVLKRADLLDSLRATTITSRDVILSLQSDGVSKLTASKVSYGEARSEAVSDAEAVIQVSSGQGDPIRQTTAGRNLLVALDRVSCDVLRISADTKQTRIQVDTLDASPPSKYIFMAVQGVDEIDYEEGLR